MDSDASAQPPRTAVVAGGEEDTRVLLRGLLRLHHFRVLGEARGLDDTLALLATTSPRLLLADGTLSEGTPEELSRKVKERFPEVWLVLVLPGTATAGPPSLRGPDAIVQRPFRVADFDEAVRGGSRST